LREAVPVSQSVGAKLLEPLNLGSLQAPNRIIFGPHETNLGSGRSLSDAHVAYYKRRAAGGAGIIITEEASVHESDWPYERAPLASQCAQGWASVASACSAEGALVLAALGHAGGQGTSHWSQRELWAPSRVPEVNSREIPKWMEPEDIAHVIEGFAAAARLAVDSGCDGVEINAGQYSLIRQFLSGLTNQRSDEWGANRRLFLTQILTAVRSEIGPEKLLALRLSCDELAPWAGITPEQAPELAADIATEPQQGPIDLVTVVRGSIYSASATRPGGHTPPGFNLELTRAVRKQVRAATNNSVAVAVQGSIVDVAQAEWALTDDVADAVEMTRAQISDAELVSKLRSGSAARIRPCTLSNQKSQVRDNRNPIVTALGDPLSGYETKDAPPETAAAHRVELTVVGGGPGGLEAARVAAARGHRVRLFEASDSFGGMVRVAAKGPGWERLALLVDWLEAECRVEGVELMNNHRVTPDQLAGHVILAVGGRNGLRSYEQHPGSVVRTAAEALDQPDSLPEGAVLIWDPIGGPIGVALAELLAARGIEVHFATQDNIVGNELARSGDLAPANARLMQAGVHLHPRKLLRSVAADGATLEDRFSAQREQLPVAVVIDAGHRLPNDALGLELAGVGLVQAASVGDCVAPRTIYEAILEGRRAAIALG
jgi:2,4-dienoyl-CoA reductase (NADPH2)